jgi:hypothetical protein
MSIAHEPTNGGRPLQVEIGVLCSMTDHGRLQLGIKRALRIQGELKTKDLVRRNFADRL